MILRRYLSTFKIYRSLEQQSSNGEWIFPIKLDLWPISRKVFYTSQSVPIFFDIRCWQQYKSRFCADKASNELRAHLPTIHEGSETHGQLRILPQTIWWATIITESDFHFQTKDRRKATDQCKDQLNSRLSMRLSWPRRTIYDRHNSSLSCRGENEMKWNFIASCIFTGAYLVG